MGKNWRYQAQGPDLTKRSSLFLRADPYAFFFLTDVLPEKQIGEMELVLLKGELRCLCATCKKQSLLL